MRTKLFAAVAALTLCAPALAADYPWQPDRPITLVVPWGAGGATDQVSRVTAGILEQELGQSVVVVNQPGASGSIGKKSVMDGPHDGYTWAAGAPKQLGTYKLLGQLDTWVDDWRLYTTVTNVPLISVNADTPYQTVGELIEAMKAGPVSVGTAGDGSSGHAAIEALKAATGIQYRHVPYDGGNPAVVATAGGETEVTTQLASEQVDMIRAGKLRPLAVIADKAVEIEGYGEVPPLKDQLDAQLPVLATSFGIFIPVEGTPREVFATLDQIWAEVIPDAELLQKYARERGALFTPSYGEAAREQVWPEIQADAWSFHGAGRTVMSPEELGIPKPGA
jgi:tripartite-type tricarboxylate transporter receptor subunit TctC